MLCRATACGCETNGSDYCDMCAQFTPICPQCGAVYGEHRTDCTCPDGYDDSREGPWDTEVAARQFADNEVGAPWDVICGADDKWYVMIDYREIRTRYPLV
jgi:hypothetical protein